jgi:hypothetical protein
MDIQLRRVFKDRDKDVLRTDKISSYLHIARSYDWKCLLLRLFMHFHVNQSLGLISYSLNSSYRHKRKFAYELNDVVRDSHSDSIAATNITT